VFALVRKGIDRGLAELEEKALNIGTPAEGGYAVPEDLDRRIDSLLKDVSPIRAVANVVRIGSSSYRKLVSLSDAASGWVGETAARPETGAPTFAEVVPPLGEIYANPAATQAMLDDAFFDVESWLAEELSTEFGVQEGTAFVTGDGTAKPKGFLTYPTSAADDSTRAFGTLQHVATGVSGGFPATNPADILIDLVHALRPVYRHGAVFAMNTGTLSEIRKFKDADGNYLWRPGLADGAPATLMGYRVIEAQDMPEVAADSLSVAFGNFQRGYTITDRTGARLLRDPFSNKPFVHFYTTKRVGGGVVNSEAIKLLKFAL
ncbi:MAG: phage major capsid protein, partial [Alphaproteobacteria bacterium]